MLTPYYWLLLAFTAAQLAGQPEVSAWDILKRDLGDASADKRKQAVLAVGSIGATPDVIDILNGSLRDKDVVVRKTAAALIGDVKYRQCIPTLQAALDDTPEVAVQAAKSLWIMGDRSGRRIIEAVYTGQEKGGPGFIEGAMRDAKSKLHNPMYLFTTGVNEASGALLGPFSMGIIAAEDALKDSGAPGRALAVNMLAEDCTSYVATLMDWSLENDNNTFVRAATAKALGRCGNVSTIPKLMLLLADNNNGVRDMAAASVVKLTIEKVPRKPGSPPSRPATQSAQ